MFKSLSRSAERGGAVIVVLPILVASLVEQGRMPAGIHLVARWFKSTRRSVDRSVSRIDLSPAKEKENEWRMQAGLQERASAAKIAEGRMFKPSLPSLDGK